MTPARPMLAEALAVLTDLPAEFWRGWDADRIIITDADVRVRLAISTPLPIYAAGPVPWVTRSVAEAFEILQTRDLIPMGYVGRFVCGAGVVSTPGTMGELASWASLGFAAGDDDPPAPDGTPGPLGVPSILGAEELAATYGRPVAWEIRDPVVGIGQAYREGSVGERLLNAGIATWISGGHLTLCVPPLAPARPAQ